MPQMHQNISKFEIKRELAKNANFKANVYDKLALINMWNQYPYEDITDKLVRKYIDDPKTLEAPVAPFTDWLKSNGPTLNVSEPFIRFKKIGRTNTHFRIMRTSAEQFPGANHKEFEIVLNTDLFKPGSKVAPQESFIHEAQIQSGPDNYGDGFKYRAVYLSTDPNAYLPTQFLREGTRWVSAGGPSFSERSTEWGPVMLDHGHSILVYQIPLFQAAYEVELTDEAIVNNYGANRGANAMQVNYAYTITDKDNQLPSTTISDAELRIRRAMESDMDKDILFGRASFPVPDKSTDLFRKNGAGILNQLEDGNWYKYSKSNFRIQEVTDYLDTVWNSPGGRIRFIVGKEAAKLVDKAIRREYGERTFIEKYEDYVEKIGSFPGGVDKWMFKQPMFQAYELKPWGVVEFVHQEWMDNRNWRGPKDPITGMPLLSWMMIANRYYGTGESASVRLVNRPDMEVWDFQGGVVGPNGMQRGGLNGGGRHRGRYGNLFYQKEYGAFIENINDFIAFSLNVK